MDNALFKSNIPKWAFSDRQKHEKPYSFSQPAREHTALKGDKNKDKWTALCELQQDMNSTQHCKTPVDWRFYAELNSPYI